MLAADLLQHNKEPITNESEINENANKKRGRHLGKLERK